MTPRPRSYLVTGGAGFIGSHLTTALLEQGHEVTALDDLSTGRAANVDHVGGLPRFRFVHGSVLDTATVDELVRDAEVVVHLAGAVGVRLILEHPLQSFVTNVRGTEAVLEAAHRHRRTVLLASTSEVYGKNDGDGLREDGDGVLGSPSIARWSYSASKLADEVLAHAYRRELGVPVVIMRFFNTVGPRQSPAYGMVLPTFVHQALAGAPLTVHGTGLQRRCFCHVLDTVDAIVRLLEHPSSVGATFNVGSTEEITILDLAHRVTTMTGSSSPVVLVPYEEAFDSEFEDMMRRRPDTSRLRDLTGWHPRRDLDAILRDTIADVLSTRGNGAHGTVVQRASAEDAP